MNYYNGIAKNQAMAEEAAGEFFKTNFNHSGIVGRERTFTTHCACGETLAIEYYSKDDPGMDDTFTAVICESCWGNASYKERV